MRVWRGLLLATLLALAGCANWNAVYRTKTVASSGPRVITIDAKQREVLMVPDREHVGGWVHGKTKEGTDGLIYAPETWQATGNWRVCAEAAPDVFSALAASASGTLKADIAGKSGEVNAALAIAETAATIERTQTINLLRESFYRTCERYMSGAIKPSTFVVQAGRDARAMVAVLAIEQLTTAARRPSTIIVGGGTSASVTSPQDWARTLGTAQADAAAAAREKTRVTELNHDAATAACDSGTTDEQDACKKKKKDAGEAIARADQDAKDTQQRYDDLRGIARDNADAAGVALAKTTGGGNDAGKGDRERSVGDLVAVATAVKEITSVALAPNEMQLFCIQRFEDHGFDAGSKLDGACLELLNTSIKTEGTILQKLASDPAIQEQGKTQAAREQILSDKIVGELIKRKTQLAELRGLGLCKLQADIANCIDYLRDTFLRAREEGSLKDILEKINKLKG